MTRDLLLCGVVGPPLFILTFLIEGATRPGYSWYRNYVSQLATGDGGWVQTVNFLVYGALSLALATGVWRVGPRVLSVVLAIYALGLLVAGVFAADPTLGYPPGAPTDRTTHGSIHGLAGLIVFSSNAVACFVAAFRFRTDPRWRGFAPLSVVAGVAILALFVASTAVSVADELGALPNGPTGLLQRVSIAVGSGWIALLAYRLRRDAPVARG
ncbi:MAG TPA: DUF998 domain-containing protein [Candidatus Limnocylindria bacterium]|nr:DUF998 domain-containing protein [Candidatus Limnocylindria bacterium]